MRVLVTGATGFIGTPLCAALAAEGHATVALSRDVTGARRRLPDGIEVHGWQPLLQPAPGPALQGVDVVVHLAGESVAGRWTAHKRAAIRDSRVIGTRHLVAAMQAMARPPSLLVSASAVGYYGDRGEEILTESAPQGHDFLATVCRQWELEARRAESLGCRVSCLRTGIVLGTEGGALRQMLLPAKLGLGGPLGSGRQWWSWIHRDDLIGIILRCLRQPPPAVLNTTAPEPVRQRRFARELGTVLHRPAFLPAPEVALRLLVGGFASELLSSKRVLPRATIQWGYDFAFRTVGEALRHLLASAAAASV